MKKIYQKPVTQEEVCMEVENEMLAGSPGLSETAADSEAENLSRFMLLDAIVFE